MNGNNMETDTTQDKQDEVNLKAEPQVDCQIVAKSEEDEDLQNPFYPIVSVQVKEEPEDTEHRLTSPANDSGISPGHASNGSDSLGHQSPKQNGPCSIPDPYNRTESNPHSQEPPNQSDLALQRLAYQQFIQQTALFGIEAVRQAYFPNRDQNVGPKDVTLQPYHAHIVKQNNQWSIPIPIPRTSPSNRPASPSKRMSPFSGTASYPNQTSRPNTTSPPVNSPYSNTEPQGPDSTAPMIPPALNPGLSDDNSGTSSSHEGSMSEDYMEDSFYRKVEENPLRSLQMSLDRMENKDKFYTTDSNGLRNTFQCPFCAFNTLSRAEFNKHNEVHCPDLKCERCDFVTKKEEVLRTHAREAHLISPEAVGIEKEEIPGITVPKVNSQGKVKTSKCKQCGYIANTKVQFWDHIRGHIPPDKLLTCPRCPFVTEYKHHLEYHLRNHADSKPFRCDVCKYKCVNKSMLNSHLKSHSNIYQYRCNSCKYITKYCHSLKLHLRKYNHDPDTVLNPDGTPNPGPIIDVYGTRRGPKQRTKKVHNGKNANGISIVNPNIMEGVSIPKGTKNTAPYNFGFLPHLPMVSSGRVQYAVQPTFSANHIEAGYPMTMNQFVQDNSQYNKHENNIHNTYDQHYYAMNNYNNNNNNNTNGYEVKEMFQWKHVENVAHQAKEESIESNPSSGVVPLDLSRTETTRVENILKQPAENVTPLQTNGVQANIQETPQASTPRHRRKGPAFKLDDIARRLHQQSVIGNNVAVEPKENSQNSINSGSSQNSAIADRLSTANSRNENTEMLNISPPRNDSPPKDFNEECTFCHISFRNPVLHALHKGFHGFEDPFQCNRCGVRTGNEIAFNLHLTQTPHN